MSAATATAENEVFVTQYALTTGVFKVTGKPWDQNPVGDPRPAFRVSGRCSYLIFHGDWHVTEEAARQRVKAMVSAAKAGLVRKQLKLDEILAGLKVGTLPMATEKR